MQLACLSLIRNEVPDFSGSKNKMGTVFIIHWFCVSAGLCDINEGTVVPEDRCKSPTSGIHNFPWSATCYFPRRWHALN